MEQDDNIKIVSIVSVFSWHVENTNVIISTE